MIRHNKVRGMHDIKTMSTRSAVIKSEHTHTFKAHTLEQYELVLKKWITAKHEADMIWLQKERELEALCEQLGITYGVKKE